MGRCSSNTVYLSLRINPLDNEARTTVTGASEPLATSNRNSGSDFDLIVSTHHPNSSKCRDGAFTTVGSTNHHPAVRL